MNENIKIAIVDDDFDALSRTREVVKSIPYCELVGEFTSHIIALRSLPNLHPHLILMDYDLGAGRNGADLFNDVRDNQMKVIFVTQFAEKQVDLAGGENVRNAIFKNDRNFDNNLIAAIKSYQSTRNEIRNIELKNNPTNGPKGDSFQVNLRNGESVRIVRDEVMYFEQSQNSFFITIHTINGSYETSNFSSFNDAENEIKGKYSKFLRVLSKGGCRTINLKYFHGEKLPNHKIRLTHLSKEYIVQCSVRPYRCLQINEPLRMPA